jgi:hypothetical protein
MAPITELEKEAAKFLHERLISPWVIANWRLLEKGLGGHE